MKLETLDCLEADDVGVGEATDARGRPAVGLGLRGGHLDEPVGVLLTRSEAVRLIGRLSVLVVEVWPDDFESQGGGR